MVASCIKTFVWKPTVKSQVSRLNGHTDNPFKLNENTGMLIETLLKICKGRGGRKNSPAARLTKSTSNGDTSFSLCQDE